MSLFSGLTHKHSFVLGGKFRQQASSDCATHCCVLCARSPLYTSWSDDNNLLRQKGPPLRGGARPKKKKSANFALCQNQKKKKRFTPASGFFKKKKNNPQWHSALPRCSAMLLTPWSSLSCFLLLSVLHIATFGSKRAAATPLHAVDRVGSLGALLDCGDPKKKTQERCTS